MKIKVIIFKQCCPDKFAESLRTFVDEIREIEEDSDLVCLFRKTPKCSLETLFYKPKSRPK